MTPVSHAAGLELIVRALIVQDGSVLLARERGSAWFFLPGGHVEPGEPIEAALRRELREELAADARSTEFLGAIEHAYQQGATTRHELNLVFATPLAEDDPTGQEPHLEFEFRPLDHLATTPLRPDPLKRALLTWLDDRTPFWHGHSPTTEP